MASDSVSCTNMQQLCGKRTGTSHGSWCRHAVLTIRREFGKHQQSMVVCHGEHHHALLLSYAARCMHMHALATSFRVLSVFAALRSLHVLPMQCSSAG